MRVSGQICIIGSNPSHCWNTLRALPLSKPAFVLVGPAAVKVVGTSRWCVRHVLSDLSDYNAAALNLSALQSSFDCLILVPADLAGVKIVAAMHGAHFLRFPCSSVDTVTQLADKWAFFKQCTKLEIKMPQTKLFDDKIDLFDNWPGEELKYPFVIKPTNGEDGEGVQIITSRKHYQKTVLDQDYTFTPLLAQCFVPGHDIDISTFGIDGAILHYAVQTYVNGRLWFIQSSELLRHATKIIDALRFSGILHIDARIDSRTGEINLIEGNPRVWASMNALSLMDLNFIRAGLELILTGTTSGTRTIAGESVSLAQVVLRAIGGGKLNREQRLILKHTVFDAHLLLRRLIRGHV
jgi:predicted ATP-grasp superfamily ATP-dependent carboligase